MASKKKINIVASVEQSLDGSGDFALIKFDKVTHKDLESLRKDLKKNNANLKVIKNSLFQKAINKISQKNMAFKEIAEKFFPVVNRSAIIIFKDNWFDGLKAYHNTVKDNENISFKFGYIGKIAYDENGMLKLANLPGQDEIMGKLIGAMKNPIVRTTRSMKNPMQKFVFVLNAKAKQG